MPHYKNPIIKETAHRIPVLCGLLFAAYCFIFLYRSQSYVQAVAQRVSMPEAAAFHPLFTATFCTVLLTLLGALLQRVFRWLPLRFLALPWFIPFLVFALLSQWHYPQLGDVQPACGFLFYLIVLIFYLVLFILSRVFEDSSGENECFSTYTWPNLLFMLLFMLLATRISNTDRLLYQTLQTNRCLQARDYRGILNFSDNNCEMSQSQTAMVSLALDKTGNLGDHLFHYVQQWGSEGLLPMTVDSMLQENTSHLQGHNIGYMRGEHLSTSEFLDITKDMPNIKHVAEDYQLCCHLLDRRLDLFIRTLLSNTDSLSTELPVHYREAIILYQHTRTNPVTNLKDYAMEANLMDFLKTKNATNDARINKKRCQELFDHTYWYYYYWAQKSPSQD